jgi:glycerol-1-phosphatase
VTSGTRPLVSGWLRILNLALPQYLVTAEDVKRGKPDPACYLLGKQKLNLKEPASILVVEDAPAGIRAGKAAGFKVLALATTHRIAELRAAGADWIIRDLASVSLKAFNGASRLVTLEIRDALEIRRVDLW